MKRVIIFAVVITLLLLIPQKQVVANEKFKGRESEFLSRCAQRLDESQVQECREFKEYYQSLGKSILQNSESLKKEVNELKSDIEKLVAKSQELTKEIQELQSQKEIITQNIVVVENNIQAIQDDIKDLKEKIQIRKNEIRKRMQDNQLYINGNRRFTFLLDAQDFDDLLRRISILGQISKFDEERIILLRKDQESLVKEENELVRQKEELVSQKQEIDEKEKQIQVLKDANQELINTYLANKAAIEEKIRQEESNYETIVANASKINTSATPRDIETIVNNNQQSSGFGPVISGSYTRSAGTWYYPSDFGGGAHMGMDFAGHQGMGQPVLAPADSIILMTKNSCSDYGYLGNRCGSPISGGGNWISLMTEIDGTTYVFLYFHLKSGGITTSNMVSRGEVIGYMGTSGSSTGPHLHVEIIKVGDISLNDGYKKFISSGYNPTAGAGWGLSTRCDVKSPPCRIRPETFY